MLWELSHLTGNEVIDRKCLPQINHGLPQYQLSPSIAVFRIPFALNKGVNI